jgi:hypothetical protein
MKFNREIIPFILLFLLSNSLCTETFTNTNTLTQSAAENSIFIAASLFKHRKRMHIRDDTTTTSTTGTGTTASTTGTTASTTGTASTTSSAATTSTGTTGTTASTGTSASSTSTGSTSNSTETDLTDSDSTASTTSTGTASTNTTSSSSSTPSSSSSSKKPVIYGNAAAASTSPTPSSASNSNDSSLTDLNLGPGPIYYTSWVKYFKMMETDKDKHQSFYKNMDYYEQMKYIPKKSPDFKGTSKDKLHELNKYIISPQYFYTILFKDNLNFITSRNQKIAKTIDFLNIEEIDDVEESSGYGDGGADVNENGIQEFGNFAEGFCFKILTGTNATGKTKIWVLCTETIKFKTQLMNMLKKLKIHWQREHGKIVIPDTVKKQPTAGETINFGLTLGDDGASMKIDAGKNNITDGYWIVLQDWSQCSLKCGGGISTLHRMCVPPKNGGLSCQGPDVFTRPCNTGPCPNSTSLLHGNDTNYKTLKPVVKVLPFSTRPQRYSKCKIKESDLMYTQSLEELDSTQRNGNPLPQMGESAQKEIQIPVRVVMNNKTVTLFNGESYDSQIKTFDLQMTELKSSSEHPNCFYFTSGTKKAELCPFGFDTSDKTLGEWFEHFNLFKHQCHTNRTKFGLNITDDDALKRKLQEKIAQAKKDVLDDREQEMKTKLEFDDEQELQSDVKASTAVTLQAIQKELDLEAMIRREEKEREKNEIIEIKKKIDEEKKKSDCLIKNIKKKQEETEQQQKMRQVAETIQTNKQIAAQQISVRRLQLKQQIEKMRQQTEEKKRKMIAQLQQVRVQMATQMNKAYKIGKPENCAKASASDQDKYNYCTANFPDNTDMLGNCKEAEFFCEFCCNNEIGEMYEDKRNDCIKNNCPARPTPNQQPKESDSRWMFQQTTQ